jgi:alkanesulfonate monooxygenase SsuD/methylene tetrahydromethanopterin reductase-like flavin-dependent oxidoreductase (luciferase family)
MPQVHFGAMVPQIKRAWTETQAAAQHFEDLGFDSLWVNDHLYGPQSPQIPILEAWSTVAALAATTSKVSIGTLVTPVGMRNVAHLGKTIATIDHISGGRIIPGLGAGWMPREFTDFGVPFLSTKERLGQLREGVQLLRRMWSQEEDAVTFEGKYVKAQNVVTLPKPERQPRLLRGGAGEQVTMKIAARYADIWNNLAGHQDRIAQKVEVLRGHCDAIGRDPAEITVAQQCLVTIGKDEATVKPMIETAQRIFGGHMGNPGGALALSGTPGQIAERIQKHIDAGCTMFNIEFFGRDVREPSELFAKEVMPQFR